MVVAVAAAGFTFLSFLFPVDEFEFTVMLLLLFTAIAVDKGSSEGVSFPLELVVPPPPSGGSEEGGFSLGFDAGLLCNEQRIHRIINMVT